MTASAVEPHGTALLACLEVDQDAVLEIVRDDGLADAVQVNHVYRCAALLVTDGVAPERARGRILDAGAGAGIHGLALQERAMQVAAITVARLRRRS